MLLHVSIAHYFLIAASSLLYGHKHLFVHSPSDDYVNYFQLMAITDKSAINIWVQLQVLVWVYASISLGWTPRSGMAW